MARTNTIGTGAGTGSVNSVAGAKSIVSTPNPIINAGTLEFVNDELNPLDGKFYGKQAGAKGWFFPPAAGGIVTVTEAQLIALQVGSTLDVNVIYYVTDAGNTSNQLSAPYAQIYVRAFSTTQLNPAFTGQLQNAVMSSPMLVTGQYFLSVSPFFSEVDFTQTDTHWSVNFLASNFAQAAFSLDSLVFDGLIQDSTFENYGHLTFSTTTIYNSTTLKNINIEFNSNSGCIFNATTLTGNYASGGSEFTINGANFTISNSQLFKTKMTNIGADTTIDYLSDREGIWDFNNQTNSFVGYSDFGQGNSLIWFVNGKSIFDLHVGDINDFQINDDIANCVFEDLVHYENQNGASVQCRFESGVTYTNNFPATNCIFGYNCDVNHNDSMDDSTFEPFCHLSANGTIDSITVGANTFLMDNGVVGSVAAFQDCEIGSDNDIERNLNTIIGINTDAFAALLDNLDIIDGSFFGAYSVTVNNIGALVFCNIDKDTLVDTNDLTVRANVGQSSTYTFNGISDSITLEQGCIVTQIFVGSNWTFEQGANCDGQTVFSILNGKFAQGKSAILLADHANQEWGQNYSTMLLPFDLAGSHAPDFTAGADYRYAGIIELADSMAPYYKIDYTKSSGTLTYTVGTPFTPGEVVTDTITGATGVVQTDAAGVMTLMDVIGTFNPTDAITGSGAGAGVVLSFVYDSFNIGDTVQGFSSSATGVIVGDTGSQLIINQCVGAFFTNESVRDQTVLGISGWSVNVLSYSPFVVGLSNIATDHATTFKPQLLQGTGSGNLEFLATPNENVFQSPDGLAMFNDADLSLIGENVGESDSITFKRDASNTYNLQVAALKYGGQVVPQ